MFPYLMAVRVILMLMTKLHGKRHISNNYDKIINKIIKHNDYNTKRCEI